MIDLDRTFRDVDHAPVADLWPEIVTRSPKPLPPAPPGRRAATIVIALLIAFAGIGFAIRIFSEEPSGPAGPSPTPSSVLSAGPAATPSSLAVSYDARDLEINGLPRDPANGFRIDLFRGSGGRGTCVHLWDVPSAFQDGVYSSLGRYRCFGHVRVGDGFGVGDVVVMFAPPDTSTAIAHPSEGGLDIGGQVLQLPRPFINQEATQLGRPIDLKLVVLIGADHGGSLVTTDAAGDLLGTSQLPVPVPVDVGGICGNRCRGGGIG